MTNEKQLDQIIIRKVPKSLHQEFKAQCAREGKSMQEKVIELIGKYTEKAGDKNGR